MCESISLSYFHNFNPYPTIYTISMRILSIAGIACQLGFSDAAFNLVANWVALNYTWDPSTPSTSEGYWLSQGYPDSNALAGINVGKNGVIYVTVPRWKSGVPSTLNIVQFESDGSATLAPFPSWDFNTNTLRNCQSMKIDAQNRMWIIDVGRENFYDATSSTLVNAPSKVLVLNLDTNQLEWTYQFPNSVVPYDNSFLNDIALDLDGGFAYFTSTWGDGLIVVYDFQNNASWSFSGISTQRDVNWDFIVNGYNYGTNGIGNSPVDGIALSADASHLYYCAVQGVELWKIPTAILKNSMTSTSQFNNAAILVGNKTGPSDGIMIQGNTLFYGDIQNSALKQVLVGQNIPFSSSTLGTNENDFRWIDTFTDPLDGSGLLYFTSNHLDEFFNGTMSFDSSSSPNFRIYRYTSDADSGSDNYTIASAVLTGGS